MGDRALPPCLGLALGPIAPPRGDVSAGRGGGGMRSLVGASGTGDARPCATSAAARYLGACTLDFRGEDSELRAEG